MEQFIGPKTIKESKEENSLVTVEYIDGTKEILAKLMFEKIISETACDLTALRERRITPVVAEVLGILRNWGIRLNELQYMSLLLNTSLQENERQALLELWRPILPTINSLDDVDLIAIDNILRTKPVLDPKVLKLDVKCLKRITEFATLDTNSGL